MVNFRRRLSWLQTKMEEKRIDLIVYGNSPDVQYLSGSQADWRRCRDLRHPEDCLFVPRDGDPILMSGVYSAEQVKTSWIKDIKNVGLLHDFKPAVQNVIRELVSELKTVAIGEYTWSNMTLAVASICKGAKFINADGLLDDLRMIKEPEELKKLKSSAKLTEDVMEEVITGVSEGDTMHELTVKIETMGRKRHASDVSFMPKGLFYKSGGPTTHLASNYDQDQGLESGSSIAFDVGFILNGYCSDWGRSFYLGTPGEPLSKAYEALEASIIETIDAIGEEVHKTNEIFPSIEAVCDREGYGDELRDWQPNGIVGHQIGVECHEPPWLKPKDGMKLQDNMVFCMEPKLWKNGEYFLRVEDMVLIRNGKAESLTNYNRVRFQL
jgi:Xaa-Pro aminopeptidase